MCVIWNFHSNYVRSTCFFVLHLGDAEANIHRPALSSSSVNTITQNPTERRILEEYLSWEETNTIDTNSVRSGVISVHRRGGDLRMSEAYTDEDVQVVQATHDAQLASNTVSQPAGDESTKAAVSGPSKLRDVS